MSSFDLLLLVPIGVGAFNGYKKGVLIEVFGIVAFIVAILIGFKFLYFGSEVVENTLGTDRIQWLSPYLSFFVVFLPALFIIRQLGLMMKKAIRLTFLGVLDGLLGALLGAITVTFGMSLLLWIIGKLHIPLPAESAENSQFFSYIKGFAPQVISLVSDWLPGGNWIEYLEDLKDKITY